MILIAKTYWGGAPFDFRAPPENATVVPVKLRTADFREVRGLLWSPRDRKPRVGAVCMHPRVDFTRHYTFPRLVAAGVACLGANTRNPNNDTDTVHEELILDVGACVQHLVEHVGVDRVVLIGNSGGGSLNAFYQAQARLPATERLARAPGGGRTRLREAELRPADGLVYLAAHRGEGKVLEECIDPAVVDEHDPLASDASLDMYDERNGFREPPEWSEYSDEFVARFREAQRARVRRLDAIALEHLARSRAARELESAPEFEDKPPAERRRIQRERYLQPVMVIYRTMANPNYVDRHLDPSDREYGSLLSERPDLMNFQYIGFARTCTPRAWLSTWSGVSSNADVVRNVARIEEPTLVVNAGRDREIFPRTDAEPIFRAVASPDKTFVQLDEARHYFEPDFGSSEAPAVEALMDRVVPWLQERFGE